MAHPVLMRCVASLWGSWRPAGEDPAPCVALRDGRCAVAASWGALLLDARRGTKGRGFAREGLGPVTIGA